MDEEIKQINKQLVDEFNKDPPDYSKINELYEKYDELTAKLKGQVHSVLMEIDKEGLAQLLTPWLISLFGSEALDFSMKLRDGELTQEQIVDEFKRLLDYYKDGGE